LRGERNGTRSREPRGERGEHAEVGVKLDTFDATDAKRREARFAGRSPRSRPRLHARAGL
jgi:hypothetical protein